MKKIFRSVGLLAAGAIAGATLIGTASASDPSNSPDNPHRYKTSSYARAGSTNGSWVPANVSCQDPDARLISGGVHLTNSQAGFSGNSQYFWVQFEGPVFGGDTASDSWHSHIFLQPGSQAEWFEFTVYAICAK